MYLNWAATSLPYQGPEILGRPEEGPSTNAPTPKPTFLPHGPTSLQL